MSAPLGGLLKHIPCPNGDACTTYRCLFRHAKDETGLASSSAADNHHKTEKNPPEPLASNAPATVHAAHDKTNPQQQASLQGRAKPGHHVLNSRKRAVATDSEPIKAHDAGTAPEREAKAGLGRQDATHKAPGAGATVSTSSSRPLKRPRVGQADSGMARAKTSGIKAAAPALEPHAKPIVEAKKPGQRPKESLNPRLVKSAPARHEIRLRLVNMIYRTFKRLNNQLREEGSAEEKATLVLSEQDLIVLALDLEESYALSKSSSVYGDALKHRVLAYTRMELEAWKKERTEYVLQQQEREKRQHDSAAALPESAKPDQIERERIRPVATNPPPPPPKLPDQDLPAAQEFEILKRHLLTPIDKLAHFGYVPVVPSAADIQAARDAEAVSGGWEVCTECSTRFQVFPGRREEDGALASRGPCVYHPARYIMNRDVYGCCGSPSGARGCATNVNHHFKVNDVKRLAALWNFVETPANPIVPADRAVCFDCEMAYTVYGMEVVRLTATDWRSGRVLLDVLVRPLGEIIDLNSQYSGVWPKDMAEAQPYSAAGVDSSADASTTEKGPGKGDDASGISADAKAGGGDDSSSDAKLERPPLQIVPSPQAARELLFSLISPETPLIGHGLENDLNVMRIVHPTLVDTVLLFPHPRGLPSRNSLKNLMMHHLGRYIQQKTTTGGEQQGHDSAEDARAAGDLVRYKIKEKWRMIRLA